MNTVTESIDIDTEGTADYTVSFVFDYCVITAAVTADYVEIAPDMAWEWVANSGIIANRADCIDEIVTVTSESGDSE